MGIKLYVKSNLKNTKWIKYCDYKYQSIKKQAKRTSNKNTIIKYKNSDSLDMKY